MARRTFPRRQEDHERKAAEILRRHASATGWTPSLPVPIELIVDQSYGLRIETRELPDPPGRTVLGALYQDDAAIVINERHQRFFAEMMGTLEFTLAHELAHWLYDADVGQTSLFSQSEPLLCLDPNGLDQSDTARIREVNANKLAAAVLMPADLVRAVNHADLVTHHREYASRWGVSAQALEIRLTELGIALQRPPDAGLPI